jgi:hypothetical protein
MNTFKLSQAASFISTIGGTNTLLLQGPPGIGKSSILHVLEKSMPDYQMCYIDVANLDLGDLGMPVIDRDAMVTHYAPNARFGISKNQHKPVVIMLDELGKAARPVLNMLLPVILEHRIGDVKLPTGSIVFATTNLDTDGVGDNIPAHAYNRMTVVRLANPSVEEWLVWADANDIAPEVKAFVKQYPQVFDCYVDLSANEKNPHIFNPLLGNTKAFCSHRSIAQSSNIIKQRNLLGADATLTALIGTIGEAGARDMDAMLNVSDQLPTFEAVVNNPTGAKLPEGAGAMFIMAFMLAGRVSASTMDAVMQYVNRIGEVSFEGHSLFITTVSGNASKVAFAVMNREFTKQAAKLGKYF